MMKRAVLLTLVLGSNSLVDAQVAETMLAEQVERRSNAALRGNVKISRPIWKTSPIQLPAQP
jgi:hypothetical protein